MTTADAAFGIAVLGAAGTLPVLAGVGLRLVAIPLAPLGGAVIAAVASAAELAIGGPLLLWFAGLSLLATVAVLARWIGHSDSRPWLSGRSTPTAEWREAAGGGTGRHSPASGGGPTAVATGGHWHAVGGVIGAIAVVASCSFGLRSLSAPGVGFDARTVWLMRAGWFLQPHRQLLVDMRIPSLELYQSAYPPLVSASTAVVWAVTGAHSYRLGVVVIALLNACALAVAAFSVVECGRLLSGRLLSGPASVGAGSGSKKDLRDPSRSRSEGTAKVIALVPLAIGIVAAVLLVVIAFGIVGPFMTDGYADPTWSLAAVGAVAYGLQLPVRQSAGVTAVLLMVVGLTKIEGLAVAVCLILLVAGRRMSAMRTARSRLWSRPVLDAILELAVVFTWQVSIRIIHARGVATTFAPAGRWFHRFRPTIDALSSYLHVFALAVPIAVVAGLLLPGVRRSIGLANDLWGWAAAASALAVVIGALVTDSGSLTPLLAGSIHRLTEAPALTAWWIIATWAVIASAAPVLHVLERARPPEQSHP
ncbi:MAG: hypothetical protein ACYDES_10750 [Acidimicrobiales bacterium]